MGIVVPEAVVYEAVENILKTEEAWRVIDTISGASTGKLNSIVLLNPGRHFKQSFLCLLESGSRDIWLVAKAFKRFSPQRFSHEILPRTDTGLSALTPSLVGTNEKIHHTQLNTPFVGADHQLLLEQFVDGTDLVALRGKKSYPIHLEACRNRYRLACNLLHRRSGRVLGNINPKNIRIPSGNPEKPLIVDWGSQITTRHPGDSDISIERNLQ